MKLNVEQGNTTGILTRMKAPTHDKWCLVDKLCTMHGFAGAIAVSIYGSSTIYKC